MALGEPQAVAGEGEMEPSAPSIVLAVSDEGHLQSCNGRGRVSEQPHT